MDRLMQAYLIAAEFSFEFLQARVQDMFYKCGFPTTANAADDAKQVEWKFHCEVFQIVLPGSFDRDGTIPFAHGFGGFDLQFTFKVFAGKAIFRSNEFLEIAYGDHFTSEMAGQGAHIDDMIGFPHHHFIVFHHHNGIAKVPKFFKNANKTLGVPGMKPYRWLIQYI